jgi:hypothetical protein
MILGSWMAHYNRGKAHFALSLALPKRVSDAAFTTLQELAEQKPLISLESPVGFEATTC